MKSYPSVSKNIESDIDIIAFDKLDGSNIRAEWSPKRGFYKFGTRKRLLEESDKHLGKAVTLFKEKYATKMPKIFARQRWHHNVICFFEFYGSHSAFGQHRLEDDHAVTLFDVSVHKQGFLPPRKFIKLFEDLGIPEIVYEGKAGPGFVHDVKRSIYPEISFEGVVCKAPNSKRKKTGKPIMFKVKTNAWLEELRKHCAGDDAAFEKMK